MRWMASGKNLLFPRDRIPADVGDRVREQRLLRGWSQERLARRVGVTRRTVIRLEGGSHLPTSHLVHALEEVLELVELVPGWGDPAPVGSPSRGPRCRRARIAVGLTLREVAEAADVSPATLSRFEREMGDSPLLMDPKDDGPGMTNDPYARALGFASAAELEAFCMRT